MNHTEVIKIIEAGLSKDPKRVVSYVELLIQKLYKQGDERFAKRLERTLSGKSAGIAGLASLDDFANAPVDKDSRISMIEVSDESPIDLERLILSPSVESTVSTFINVVAHRDKLKQAGLDRKISLLLHGEPGCGKTTLAHYIAKQADLPLVTARLDSIVSSLLGNTSKNIRKVFDFAKSKNCILFLDEFDAIAKARNDEHEHGELKRVINSLLQSIDQYDGVLIAATNHSELLDRAVWRRFTEVLEVKNPSSEKFTSEFMQTCNKQFPLGFFKDSKKSERIVRLLNGSTPSVLKIVFDGAISKSIIEGDDYVSYYNMLMELYKRNFHGITESEELVKYLSENMITQTEISEKLGLSLRAVKAILNDKKKTI